MKNNIKQIKIKYFTDKIDKLERIDKGDLVDLRAAEKVELKAGEFKLIPLGVGMILPDRYKANVYPRSSTFKNYGILMTNSVGQIDHSFSGDEDEWKMPVYATRDTVINLNDRICQFEIVPIQPMFNFVEVDKLNDKNRNGFGSTGTK